MKENELPSERCDSCIAGGSRLLAARYERRAAENGLLLSVKKKLRGGETTL